MPSIWIDAQRDELMRRAWTLTANHTARWGKLGVAGMVAHVNDALRMAAGDLDVQAPAPAILKWAPVRYLAIHVLPMPRSAPTAPQLLERCSAADLAREQQAMATLLDALPHRATLAPAHPAFGRLTRADWGVLMHKHTDHHLRQFGA